ncbi:MAG: hypothetical protein A2636_06535 [Elusimicrobia bacterium RIFCSPHIGHO2_01_FULL_64_10]|nr:MAG: hypothetical protein A2636_06535 [Elusimicrobia bacterium RIFCSPHIGHO2_01_FULL_64_10]
MAQRGLGRGLDSLIPLRTKQPAEPNAPKELVSVEKIRPNRYQPRTRFNDSQLQELADSIREQGLIQPLIVTPSDGDGYELIAGERRLRAAKLAGLAEVPVVVRKATNREQFQLSLIENLQREDLNPIEEAQAFKRLMEEFHLTQEELAKVMGKGRVVIANTLRLLNLPRSLQDAVSDGIISAGHARNLVSIEDEKLQGEIAQRILDEKLTVREVEKIVSDWKGAISSGRVDTRRKDPEVRALEESLRKALGTKVEVRARGKGESTKGHIKIAFYSLSDLERLVAMLAKT